LRALLQSFAIFLHWREQLTTKDTKDTKKFAVASRARARARFTDSHSRYGSSRGGFLSSKET
ncbi:MAG TPA: hypothetical protein VIV62_07920, partial [Chthoniobacterales bacterium]